MKLLAVQHYASVYEGLQSLKHHQSSDTPTPPAPAARSPKEGAVDAEGSEESPKLATQNTSKLQTDAQMRYFERVMELPHNTLGEAQVLSFSDATPMGYYDLNARR